MHLRSADDGRPETSHEPVEDLQRGSVSGVFVGGCYIEHEKGWLDDCVCVARTVRAA